MYSDTQIAQGIQTYTSLNNRTSLSGPTNRSVTDIMGIADLAQMDPQQLAQMFAQVQSGQASGLNGSAPNGQRNANYYTPQLAGAMKYTLGGNFSSANVTDYMQAMGSLTPTLAGLGAPNAQLQAETLLQLGQNAGLGPQAMAGETQVYNSLAQMGSTPGLMQQYALAQVYGTKNLTASPQYWQYQQGMQQQGMQLQGLQLQQKMNVPQININADNASITDGTCEHPGAAVLSGPKHSPVQ